MKVRETYVSQSYAWGAQAQVDWHDSQTDLGGERVKLQVLAMRSMVIGAAFHCAYRHATQQAFLEDTGGFRSRFGAESVTFRL